jgi:putative flippase GtrA
MRATVHELLRFGVVGVAASVTHVVVALLLIERAGVPLLWANALAFSVAVFVSYFGNHAWTFRRAGHHRRHFPRFLAVALGGLALNQSIVFLAVEVAGMPYLYGILLVVLIVPGLSFALSKCWAFIGFARALPQAE